MSLDWIVKVPAMPAVTNVRAVPEAVLVDAHGKWGKTVKGKGLLLTGPSNFDCPRKAS